MCEHCDYTVLLHSKGLSATNNRLLVMEVIGNRNHPLSAAEIFTTVQKNKKVNKVTVYRILDLLVEKSLLHKIRMGDRAALYHLAANSYHPPHPHFYCKSCGAIDCLPVETLQINTANIDKNVQGRVDQIDIQLEGICHKCL